MEEGKQIKRIRAAFLVQFDWSSIAFWYCALHQWWCVLYWHRWAKTAFKYKIYCTGLQWHISSNQNAHILRVIRFHVSYTWNWIKMLCFTFCTNMQCTINCTGLQCTKSASCCIEFWCSRLPYGERWCKGGVFLHLYFVLLELIFVFVLVCMCSKYACTVHTLCMMFIHWDSVHVFTWSLL